MFTGVVFTAIIAFSSSALSHFVLKYPPTLGFNAVDESTYPCGGFPIAFNNITSPAINLAAPSFPIAVSSTHPQSSWLFRATTVTSDNQFNWIDLLPVLNETGLGDFCMSELTVPSEFVGQRGVVQIAQYNEGVTVYQCSAVNFVDTVNNFPNTECVNETGLVAISTDLTSLPLSNATDMAGDGSMSMSMSSMPLTTALVPTSGKFSTHSATSTGPRASKTSDSKSAGTRMAFASFGVGALAVGFAFWI